MKYSRKCPIGLYAEKLSGTAFTTPRHQNQQSWLYRILPLAAHGAFTKHQPGGEIDNSGTGRWNFVDWIDGMHLVAGAGDAALKTGIGISIFSVGQSMPKDTAFYSADSDLLIIPQHRTLDIQTEFGELLVRPNEIAVIPWGIYHRVLLPDGPSRGYAYELYQGHFNLPELGPIGSNGLTNQRDFQVPIAFYEKDTSSKWHIFSKFNGAYFMATQFHIPFDVIAWHGTYYPFKYDLGRFNTIGSISYDHPDPSIFTVLTAPSSTPGVAILDFIIFPPRWLKYYIGVMGLVDGDYDAKEGGGFQPGGASLHNTMSGHGPDLATFDKANNARLEPTKVGEGSMAFIFESCFMLGITDRGLKTCEKA
ncbi:Homogentisate 1,2-dioxygenase [Mariannaea sp. PMI_226]|nr:Homogentisate 1,2-dioxygenase [Mariannaea sp. PMI_226]